MSAIMAKLKVLQYPNPILSKKAQAVDRLTEKDLRLIREMIDLMYEEDGVGLAAPQVGISKRIIIISPRAVRGEEQIYINPEIIHFSDQQETGLEGCLSVPNVSCEVRRAKKITLKALNLEGKSLLEEFQNFPARVVQHEVDHLNGVLLIDRVDFNQRQALLGSYQRL